MGNVNFGAPREIIEKLRATFQITAFVETGTYLGGTAAWASEHFSRVITIEGSPDFHHKARERHADKTNIEFLLGDSRSLLREALARTGGAPTLFWLDAHWMPGSFGAAHECPLLEEIAALHRSAAECFILIDDARLFLAPPPLPHRAQDWPDIAAVLAALDAPGRPASYMVVIDDVVVSIPAFAREAMQPFYQERVSAIAATEQASQQPAVHPARRILAGIKRRLQRDAGRA